MAKHIFGVLNEIMRRQYTLIIYCQTLLFIYFLNKQVTYNVNFISQYVYSKTWSLTVQLRTKATWQRKITPEINTYRKIRACLSSPETPTSG